MKTLPIFCGKGLSARIAFLYFSHAYQEWVKQNCMVDLSGVVKAKNAKVHLTTCDKPVWGLCFCHYVERSCLWSIWLSNLLLSACQIRMNRMTDLNNGSVNSKRAHAPPPPPPRVFVRHFTTLSSPGWGICSNRSAPGVGHCQRQFYLFDFKRRACLVVYFKISCRVDKPCLKTGSPPPVPHGKFHLELGVPFLIVLTLLSLKGWESSTVQAHLHVGIF